MNIAAELANSNTKSESAQPKTGGLNIQVVYLRDRITDVLIHNSRPMVASRIFVGRSVEQVLALMPSLFYVCGVGQLVAALQAIESALNKPVSTEVIRAREALLMAESLREQVFSWVINWTPQNKSKLCHIVDWFNTCKRRLDWCLTVEPEDGKRLMDPDSDPAQVLRELQLHLRGAIQPFVLKYKSTSSLVKLGMSPELCELLALCDEYPFGKGANTLLLTNEGVVGEVNRALGTSFSTAFCLQPTVTGLPQETGSWARRQLTNNTASRKQKGKNVTARVRRLFDEIRQAEARFESIISEGDKKVDSVKSKGCAIVETARGTLFHRVQLSENNTVKDYQIIAPTEWNFHPHGTLKTMLSGLTLPREQVKPVSEILVTLLDPCVPWQLEVIHA
ncbi:hydrogenase expression/formation protein HupK [Alteromonas sp. I4]|nr:hydrogenase expression/formation protein HupK [Alteromonas sp. I4]